MSSARAAYMEKRRRRVGSARDAEMVRAVCAVVCAPWCGSDVCVCVCVRVVVDTQAKALVREINTLALSSLEEFEVLECEVFGDNGRVCALVGCVAVCM
jgi:hypothetical protein